MRPSQPFQEPIAPNLQGPPSVVSCPGRRKWRLTAEPDGQTTREAAQLRERKVWQTRVLQSSAVVEEHSEMALWALEKAPFCARLRHIFSHFPRVFPGDRWRPSKKVQFSVAEPAQL
jgi:hypothetical protein